MANSGNPTVHCPHCGWLHKIPLDLILEDSTVSIVRGGWTKALLEKFRNLFLDNQVKIAGAWIDLPQCSHCHNVYRYNVKTQEVQK
jgi:RNase P subunit RPR2